MKKLALLAALALQLSAASRALLPGCCTVDNSISFLNPATGGLARSLVTGSPAVSMAISPSGRYAFLANTEYNGIVTTSSVTKVDLLTDRIVATATYPEGTAVTNVAVNSRKDAVYVAYSDSAHARHIQSLTQSTLTPMNDVSFPELPGLPLVVSPLGNLLFAGVYAIRTSDLTTVGVINSTLTVGGVAVTRDGSTLYAVGNTQGNLWAVDVVNVKSLTVTQEIPTQLDFTTLIALSPDEKQVVVCASNQTAFHVIDLATTAVTSYSLPWGPGSLVLLSGSSKVVFGSAPNDYEVMEPAGVSIFDFATQQVTTYPTFAAEQVVSSPGPMIAALDESFPASITQVAPASSIVGTVPLGAGYGQGVVDENDGLILFPLQDTQSIQVLDARTLKLKGVYPLPGASLWVSYSGRSGYTLINQSQVARFDPVAMQVTGTFILPPVDYLNTVYNISPAVVSADGATLYVAFDYNFNIDLAAPPASSPAYQAGLAAYSTATTSLLHIFPETWIGSIALASGGTHGFVNVQQSNGDLALIDLDLTTGKTLRAVKAGGNVPIAPLLGVPLLSPDGSTVYAAMNSEVVAVDVATFQVTATYRSTPENPISLALTPDGQYLYATIGTSVSIFQAQTLTLLGRITSPFYLPVPALFLSN